MKFGGGTSILTQIVPNFDQETLEAMSEDGPKGIMIRQIDRNRVHSKAEPFEITNFDLGHPVNFDQFYVISGTYL